MMAASGLGAKASEWPKQYNVSLIFCPDKWTNMRCLINIFLK